MLNKEKHQLVMGQILRDIYAEPSIAPLLGFKGGTCAYFFYGLPRFSVDLDFDLFTAEETAQKTIHEKVRSILTKYGQVKESRTKRNTIFLLLSYGDKDHNIKVEINTRALIPHIERHYELKEYLGISLPAGKQAYLFSSKLAALTERSPTAMRDIYDIWYFAEKHWEIDAEVIRIRTGKAVGEYLAVCIAVIERIKDNQILQGMGELLSPSEKAWVKTKLRAEVMFLLRNYQAVQNSSKHSD